MSLKRTPKGFTPEVKFEYKRLDRKNGCGAIKKIYARSERLGMKKIAAAELEHHRNSMPPQTCEEQPVATVQEVASPHSHPNPSRLRMLPPVAPQIAGNREIQAFHCRMDEAQNFRWAMRSTLRQEQLAA
jgi:hypothetical protein